MPTAAIGNSPEQILIIPPDRVRQRALSFSFPRRVVRDTSRMTTASPCGTFPDQLADPPARGLRALEPGNPRPAGRRLLHPAGPGIPFDPPGRSGPGPAEPCRAFSLLESPDPAQLALPSAEDGELHRKSGADPPEKVRPAPAPGHPDGTPPGRGTGSLLQKPRLQSPGPHPAAFSRFVRLRPGRSAGPGTAHPLLSRGQGRALCRNRNPRA